MNKFYRLKGAKQHYAWGGASFIPQLLNDENASQKPVAELWMGAHPKGSALLKVAEKWQPLDQLIEAEPQKWLGRIIAEKFQNQLPFLFKILDVHKMLSIQLHPSIEKAKIGFEKEEKKGISRLAPNRNYRDQNHKPEFMLALSGFWLLHGFKDLISIKESLNRFTEWTGLADVFIQKSTAGVYEYVMRLPQKEINELLQPLFNVLQNTKISDKSNPDYWAKIAFADYTKDGNFDRGIFSIYWFNLVYLKKGEGIFQDAGIPHAYLEGQNLELMANSDNVLRGGLTPKHIDVDELLDNIVYDIIYPEIAYGIKEGNRLSFPVPVADFEFSTVEISSNETVAVTHSGPAIYIVFQGSVEVKDKDGNAEVFKKGASFYLLPESTLSLTVSSQESALIYCASVAL